MTAAAPVECHRHRSYWLASCTDCRAARRATVQDCMVAAAAHRVDLHRYARPMFARARGAVGPVGRASP